MYTRRQFTEMVATAASAATLATAARLAGAPGPAQRVGSSAIRGVTLGATTYSFRAMPRTPAADYIDTMVQACVETGGTEVEIMARLTVQPEGLTTRESVREWRLSTPMARFRQIRDKFAAKGIRVFSYINTFDSEYTDAEIDRIMEATKAMDATVMSMTMVTVPTIKRLAAFAERNKVLVAFHNRPAPGDLNEISSPDSFQRVLDMSSNFRINLDIGHFTAANEDSLAALERFHQGITHIHLKDRKKGTSGGANLPWGQGDTPIKEALQLIRDRRWAIPAIVEYEYNGTGTPIEEVKKCIDYARAALLA